MAVLSAHEEFPGAAAVLAAQAAALPQPDQLCGPFAAAAALHAVLDETPTVVELARAAGTRIWPYDVPAWRPAGAPLLRTGWDVLPRASTLGSSGTDAAGLCAAVESLTDVVVLPVPGGPAAGMGALLTGVRDAAYPVGVVANLWTGSLAPVHGTAWEVGHFVVLWGVEGGPNGDPDGDPARTRVAVADTYAELGEAGQPPGCRWVTLAALGSALAAPPGRGLVLLARAGDAAAARRLVADAGLRTGVWTT